MRDGSLSDWSRRRKRRGWSGSGQLSWPMREICQRRPRRCRGRGRWRPFLGRRSATVQRATTRAWDAGDRGAGDCLEYDAAGRDFGADADLDVAEDLRALREEHAAADFGVAVAVALLVSRRG